MRQFSSPYDGDDPFAPVFGTGTAGTREWSRALLDTEAALAHSLAVHDIIPAEAATAIERACQQFAAGPEIFVKAAESVSPVVPLVEELSWLVGEHAPYLHYGATSQDIMDTAMMLIARRGLEPITQDLTTAADAAAQLAVTHRDIPQIGRTLGQQGAVTSFGMVAGGWMTGIDAAATELARARDHLAAQLGGPVGTQESYGAQGPAVLADFAARLGLSDPGLPWHTERTRVARLAAALNITVQAVSKPAKDVTILAAGEIGELREDSGGGSSAMPQKRNPVHSVIMLANAQRATGLAAPLLASLQSELQRAAGAWQAEWQALPQLLGCTAGSATHAAALLSTLHVDSARMRSNIADSSGLLAAASVAEKLSASLGRQPARQVVRELTDQVVPRETDLRTLLENHEATANALSQQELDELFSFRTPLSAAATLVDRAVARHRETR